MSNKPFKVMLAAKIDESKGFHASDLTFPKLASPKLDGIRAYIRSGVAFSRSNKPIPNQHIQRIVQNAAQTYEGLDGELIVGDSNNPNAFQETTGAVRRVDGEPDVRFNVFDITYLPNTGFGKRLAEVEKLAAQDTQNFLQVVPHVSVATLDGLLEFEADCLSRGFEGTMVRSPNGLYKNGRATFKEQSLIKLKRFSDDEAVVVGVTELQHNNNEAFKDELGHTKRSSHQENKVGGDTLGTLICRTAAGIEFEIGTGFSADQRKSLWVQKEKLIGKLAKYKFFAHGAKDKPRHPVFLGWREGWDF